MTFSRKIAALAMGGAIVLAGAGAAFAAPAVATGSVNVRTGPSTSYGRVDTLQRNQLVEVTGCQGGWCYIEKRGADGWVSANYLQPVQQQRTTRKPSVSFSFNFGTTPRVEQPHRPDRGNHWDRDDRGNGWDRDGRGNGWDRDGRGNNWNRGDNRPRSDGSFSFGFGN